MSDACPCHSGLAYAACCGPLHAGAPAATPEALMRSRYAAYARGEVDYVLATTDPDGPAWEGPPRASLERWRAELVRFCRTTRFAGLEILEAPTPTPGQGWVTFRARLTQGGIDASFAERSRFVHRGGNWRYHAGERV